MTAESGVRTRGVGRGGQCRLRMVWVGFAYLNSFLDAPNEKKQDPIYPLERELADTREQTG